MRILLTNDDGIEAPGLDVLEKIATDLTEDVIRGAALRAGLVDTKVCAIDETWSGLRLSRRKA